MKKAIFIVGPTSIGKTNLAFKIFQKIPSVLISADSVQVFRGADVISGKDKFIETELLDIVDPGENFSVHDFVESASKIIDRSESEEKIPIIVGGTGFYIDALFGKIETIGIPRNEKLRRDLNKLTVQELRKKLKEINPKRHDSMNNSDVNNKRRLIRAIEVGPVPLTGRRDRNNKVFSGNEVLVVGLFTSMENLRKRIEDRVSKRIAMGALDEAKKLFSIYDKLSEQLKTANGYHELFEYLLGKTTFDEAVERWKLADYHHAKNQMTWFKRNKNIVWFDIEDKNYPKAVLRLIEHNFSS